MFLVCFDFQQVLNKDCAVLKMDGVLDSIHLLLNSNQLSCPTGEKHLTSILLPPIFITVSTVFSGFTFSATKVMHVIKQFKCYSPSLTYLICPLRGLWKIQIQFIGILSIVQQPLFSFEGIRILKHKTSPPI